MERRHAAMSQSNSGRRGGADVLAEEDPCAFAVGVQGDGTGGMARYAQERESWPPKGICPGP